MQISPNIFALKHHFQVNILPGKLLDRFVYSFVVFDSKIILIDCGVQGSEEEIYSFIRQSGRSISDIELLVLSHSHPDHIGSANKIKNDTQCRIVAHELERNWIEDIDTQYQQRPVPGFYNLVNESATIDYSVEDKEVLLPGKNLQIRIIHTPGHSPGLLSMLFPEEKVLFTGDAIPLENDIPNYNNFYQLKSSIDCIKAINGYNAHVSSWAAPVSGKDKMTELLQKAEKYLQRIDNSVQKNYTNPEQDKRFACKKVIDELELSPLFINPLVNNAFLSHLK